MIGIYKYENKINHKIYIGRSINITKRKWEHLHNPSPYSYFDQELIKYGEDNFNFTVLEECSIDNLYAREQYWIQFYNSYKLDNPLYGYNLTRGGEEYQSEQNPWAKLSQKTVLEIIDKLAHTKISMEDLSKVYHVHRNTISDINRCKTWSWLHNYKNNIRTESQGGVNRGELGSNKITEVEAQKIISLLEHDSRSMAALSREENISLNIIQDINRCRTWTYLHSYKKNIRKEYKLKIQKKYDIINIESEKER